MKKIFGALLALLSAVAFGATTVPVQLLNPAGSTSGQAILSTGPTTAPAWGSVSISTLTGVLPVANGGTNASSASGTALDNITGFSGTGFLTRTGAGAYAFQSATNGITLGNLAQAAANTVLANATGSTATVTAFAMPSCSTTASALNWTSGSGFTCGTVATSGSNANITSLTGLTTALSVGQGGTGRQTLTAHGVLLGEGTSAINQTAAGTAGQVLTSGGASADPAWGNPGQPYFSAYNSSSQSLTSNTWTKVTFNTKVYDSGGYYDNTTNYRYTPLVAGKYHVTMSVELTGSVSTANVFWQGAIYKNGSQFALNGNSLYGNSGTLIVTPVVSADVIMNGTTDYIEGWVDCGATTCTTGSGSLYAFFSAYYIGP